MDEARARVRVRVRAGARVRARVSDRVSFACCAALGALINLDLVLTLTPILPLALVHSCGVRSGFGFGLGFGLLRVTHLRGALRAPVQSRLEFVEDLV